MILRKAAQDQQEGKFQLDADLELRLVCTRAESIDDCDHTTTPEQRNQLSCWAPADSVPCKIFKAGTAQASGCRFAEEMEIDMQP